MDVDPPNDKIKPPHEVRKAVARLRSGKAAGAFNISTEVPKAGGETMIRGLHAFLTAIWHQTDNIPLDWKMGLVVPILHQLSG